MDWLTNYIPTTAEDAIARSSQFFSSKEFRWYLPMAITLTCPEPKSTHAVIWDEQCIRKLLPRTHTPHRAALIQDMNLLTELRLQSAPAETFQTKAEGIWYRQPGRDHIQTAIAQFYGVVAHNLYPDGIRPITELGVGVALIAEGEQFPDWVLEVAVEEFLAIHESRKAGISPAQMLNLVGADHYGFRQRSDANV